MTALSRHMSRYPKPRPETLQAKATQDRMTATLARELAQQRRQKQIDRIKRWFRLPVWRW